MGIAEKIKSDPMARYLSKYPNDTIGEICARALALEEEVECLKER